jgi:alkylation response protein AidB-like acyl-CoA dehydrogenase
MPTGFSGSASCPKVGSHYLGLKGTGSHHVTLRDTLVPAANSFDPVSGGRCQPGPLYQAVLQPIPLFHSAFAVGIAEGALDALVDLANTGRQQQRAAVPMRASEIFQYELGRIEAELRAARAFCQVQAGSHWHHALAGTLNDEALLAQAPKQRLGLLRPAFVSSMHVLLQAAAVRFMRARGCSSECATFTSRPNMWVCNSDIT